MSRPREKQIGSVGMRNLIFILLFAVNLQIATDAQSIVRDAIK